MSITAFTTARQLSLSWATSIQSMPPSYFLKINFNIILPYMPSASKLPFFLRFPQQIPACTSPPPTCYIPSPSLCYWFDHPTNILRRVQTILLFAMQSFPVLQCPLGPRYFPQHPIVKHPQSVLCLLDRASSW